MESLEIGGMKTPPSGLRFYRNDDEYEIFTRTISFPAVLFAIIAAGLIGLGFAIALNFLWAGVGIMAVTLWVFSSVFWMVFGWMRLTVKNDCIHYITFRDHLLRNSPIVVALEDVKNIRMSGGGIDSSGGSRGYRSGRTMGGKNLIELKLRDEKVFITFGSEKNAWVSIFLKRVHTAYIEKRSHETGEPLLDDIRMGPTYH